MNKAAETVGINFRNSFDRKIHDNAQNKIIRPSHDKLNL